MFCLICGSRFWILTWWQDGCTDIGQSAFRTCQVYSISQARGLTTSGTWTHKCPFSPYFHWPKSQPSSATFSKQALLSRSLETLTCSLPHSNLRLFPLCLESGESVPVAYNSDHPLWLTGQATIWVKESFIFQCQKGYPGYFILGVQHLCLFALFVLMIKARFPTQATSESLRGRGRRPSTDHLPDSAQVNIKLLCLKGCLEKHHSPASHRPMYVLFLE